MKAIILDPLSKTIVKTEIGGGIQSIYKAIGNNCGTFTCPITLPNGDTMYCDDEGLYKENIGAVMSKNGDWSYPLVGRVLIIGTNEEGEGIDAQSSVEEIKANYGFIDKDNPALVNWFNQFA